MALADVRTNPSRMTAVWAIVITVASLYLAYDVLMPIALSVLVAFLLAPIVYRFERRGLGTVASVLLTVGMTFGIVAVLSYTVGMQLYSLGEALPNYRAEIDRKTNAITLFGESIGAKFGGMVKDLNATAAEPGKASLPSSQPAAVDAPPPGTSAQNPVYVMMVERATKPLALLQAYVGAAINYLGTAGLVVVFVIFVLLEREQLRDRLIRLISNGKYTITTNAINDAAKRISRYMLAQSIVNGSYGLTIAAGLYVIGAAFGHGQGFPSFVLWGLLCALLRFVPYIGPWTAAAFPTVLSLAVYPGFEVFGVVVAMFVIIELFSNNVMEPWLYGASTGLSTVAILVAAVFWTWLWGPIGLVLSTPLTVCIVVMGRYIEQLQFLEVLLSDKPALPPSVSFYQRLLAGDEANAASVANGIAAERGWAAAADEVIVPAIVLARRDRANDDLTAAGEVKLLAETDAMIDRVAAKRDAAIDRPLVVGYPSHHRSEEVALRLLGLGDALASITLEHETTRQLPAELEARLARDEPLALVIAVIPPGGLVQARYLCRRLHKRFPTLRIVVAYFGRSRNFDRLLVRFRKAGVAYVTTSIAQTQSQLLALHATHRTAPLVPTPPVDVDGPKFV